MSVIQIIVHGLIALVPATDASGNANHMTALLVDARSQPAEASVLTGFTQCFVPHQPRIWVQTPSTAECQAADCTASGLHDCTCSLVRKEVSLQAQLSPAMEKQWIKPRPENGLPFNDDEARDFSYVVNLSRLKYRSRLGYELDERFINKPNPPQALIARMSFPFQSLLACSLGTRRDEGGNNVHPLSFRPIDATEEAGESSQALSQMVRAELTAQEGPVTLTITDFGGGNPRTLPLRPIEGIYRIELSNMRTRKGHEHVIPPPRHDLPPDHPCDGGVERDFAFFYELVKNPPPWNERPIPHVKFTRWKSFKDIEADECSFKKDHFPNSHPICGLASFVP